MSATGTIAVRRARAADAAEIAKIQVDAWRAAYRGLVPAEFLDGLDARHAESIWRCAIESGDVAVLAAASSAGSRGYGGFCALGHAQDPDLAPATALEIRALYVAPDSWRGGIGRALCAEARARARALSLRELTLWVLSANARARQFYEAVGFAADGAERVDTRLLGAPLHELRYRIGA